MPLLASGQAGTLYPPNLLFLVLTPTLANNLTIVVTFVIAGLGHGCWPGDSRGMGWPPRWAGWASGCARSSSRTSGTRA